MRSGRHFHSVSARVIHWWGITPYQSITTVKTKTAAAIASPHVSSRPDFAALRP